jgi:hypothetical protein
LFRRYSRCVCCYMYSNPSQICEKIAIMCALTVNLRRSVAHTNRAHLYTVYITGHADPLWFRWQYVSQRSYILGVTCHQWCHLIAYYQYICMLFVISDIVYAYVLHSYIINFVIYIWLNKENRDSSALTWFKSTYLNSYSYYMYVLESSTTLSFSHLYWTDLMTYMQCFFALIYYI